MSNADEPNQNVDQSPFKPVSAFDEPFNKEMIDSFGKMQKTKSVNNHLVTTMCVSTRFPEAIPLRKISSQVIIKTWTTFFTQFGMPREIQSENKSQFHN